jgi:integrase
MLDQGEPRQHDEQVRNMKSQGLLRTIPKSWHTLVLVALHAGLRFTEQMRLRWEDIDFKQRVLTVRDSKASLVIFSGTTRSK